MTSLFVMRSNFTCTKTADRSPGRETAQASDASEPVISAAVGNGSWERCPNRPEDVRSIQQALNRFSPLEGGPQPALVIDGLCGPKTRAAIAHFQKKWDLKNRWGTIDGIVDVTGPTIERLRKGAGHRKTPATDFFLHIPRVMEVITATRTRLTAAKMHYQLGPSGGSVPATRLFLEESAKKVNHHFHVERMRTPTARVAAVDQVFLNMQTAIGYIAQGTVLAADEPPHSAEGAFMFTFMGGYHLRTGTHLYNGYPVSSIYLCPKSRTLGRDAFVYAMIHELAHYCGPVDNGIDDHAYFHRNRTHYEHLGPEHAYRNADCYPQLAYDMVGLRDFRVDLNTLS